MRSARDTERPRRVPLGQFRREVVALLVASRKFDSERALRLVSKWNAVVVQRHAQGKPPCNVADHIVRYEREGVVCPCGSSNRDPDHRCKRCGRKAKTSRDPECILVDSHAYSYGTGRRDALMKRGKRGQSVMCRAKNPRDLVDVYAVRDPEKPMASRKRFAKKAKKTRAYGPYKRRGGGKTVIIVSRDYDGDREIRRFTTKALLSLLAKAERAGDTATVRRIEKELDRRGKSF